MNELNNILKQIESLENNENRTMDQDTILDNLIEQAEKIIYKK